MLSSSTVARVGKELRNLEAEPVSGVRVVIDEADFTQIRAEIDGPVGTPFAGGVFKMRLELTSEFPTVPPKGFFLTKIFHPNVSEKGEICVNTLKRDWKSEYGLRHIFLVVRCLLIDPNPESALNEEAGKLMLDGYDEFARMARIWTDIHARRRGTAASGGENADGNVNKTSESDVPVESAQKKVTAAATPSKKTKDVSKKRLKRL